MKILVLNGPNLNLLGQREENIYGSDTLESLYQKIQSKYPDDEFEFYQSNVEGELVNKIHEVGFTYDGIVFNPGAYTHTSIALRDAIAGIKTPVIEIHISNTSARESFRHTSYISPVAKGVIMGLGMASYLLGIEALKC